MNRIDQKFAELNSKKEAGFIPYLTAGDPDLATTKSLIAEMEKRGADLIELGIPFSDPIADGPVIQSSHTRALDRGTKLEEVFRAISELRSGDGCEIPIVCMVSYSIVYRCGVASFISRAKAAGIDGATIPDLPVEEADAVFETGAQNDFRIACFATPTTTEKRRTLIAQNSQGFIYYMAFAGVTGARDQLAEDMSENIEALRKLTSLPIALGFGVSTPEQAAEVAKIADAVIVGSAIIRVVEAHVDGPGTELVAAVGDFADSLVKGAKGNA